MSLTDDTAVVLHALKAQRDALVRVMREPPGDPRAFGHDDFLWLCRLRLAGVNAAIARRVGSLPRPEPIRLPDSTWTSAPPEPR